MGKTCNLTLFKYSNGRVFGLLLVHVPDGLPDGFFTTFPQAFSEGKALVRLDGTCLVFENNQGPLSMEAYCTVDPSDAVLLESFLAHQEMLKCSPSDTLTLEHGFRIIL